MPGSGHRTVPARLLPVLVGALPIEDGQTPPPVVGEIGHYPLVFSEARDDEPDATAVTVEVRAEPLRDGEPLIGRGWGEDAEERDPVWPTILHGDGWSATWPAPRPVLGRVRLRGTIGGDLGISSRQWVRGRITSAHVVTETFDGAAADRQELLRVPGGQRLRPVEAGPRWFDDGLESPGLPPGVTRGWVRRVRRDPYTVQTGVLVQLDLDDAPPPPLRPSLVPAAVSASGEDLWVLDARLPLAVRVSVTSGEAVRYPWPGRILSERVAARRVHADPLGAWIVGPDGIHRVSLSDGTVRRVDAAPSSALETAAAGTLVVVRDDGAVRRYRTYGAFTDASVPGALTATASSGDDGAVVLLLREPGRLARLGPDGAVTVGEPDPVLDEPTVTLVDGAIVATPTAGRGRLLRRVRPDLRLGPAVETPGRVSYLLAAGGRLFGFRSSGGHLEIDPDTGASLGTVGDVGVPWYLAVDGHGTVWTTDARGLRSCPAASDGVAEPVDVAALLDRGRGTA